MRVISEPLPGAKIVELVPHGDDRGSFTETFNRAKMTALGIDHEFVQDNESVSASPGTIRGIHLQLPPHAQGKLVRVLRGAVADYAIDLRPDSPTYRHNRRVDLIAGDHLAFWIPTGFGHAFCTLVPDTVVAYKVTALYAPDAERSIRWDDPDLAVDWPDTAAAPVLSGRDEQAGSLADVEAELQW